MDNMDNIEMILKKGGVGVMQTDTIYGLVGCAMNRKTVNKIYKIRKRNPKKPFVILIGSIQDLDKFGIKVNVKIYNILNILWPGKISIILPCLGRKFIYLHRGTKTLASRLPNKPILLNLLKKTGPLVAPSANLEGFKPSKTIKEAKKYFKDSRVDFFIGKAPLNLTPSTLISIKHNRIVIFRKGADFSRLLRPRSVLIEQIN